MRIPRITTLLLLGAAPLALGAQSAEPDDIKQQLQELKRQVSLLEEKAKEQERTLTKVESKTAQSGIAWGGDLRTRFESQEWSFKPYQQFMGFAPQAMPGPGGSTFYVPSPVAAPVPAQDVTNSVQWSTRLRLRMGMTIGEHAKIFGRLTMFKVHGGADIPTFNGSPNTVANSFNSGKIPTNDVLHVERASFVYDWPAVGVLSIGRQNTSDGPPFEVREGGERQATPQALAVNAIVDGLGWKFHLEPLGLPEGSLFGLCYGVGYESGLGGGGALRSSAAVVGFNFFPGANNGTALTPAQYPQPALHVASIGPLKDSTVLGAMFDIPLLFEGLGTVHAANFYLGFNRFGNMTDIPFGSLNNFPVPAMPGMGGMPSSQFVTATKPSPTSPASAASRASPTGSPPSTAPTGTCRAPSAARTSSSWALAACWGTPSIARPARRTTWASATIPPRPSVGASSSTMARPTGSPTAPPPARPRRSWAPGATCGRPTSTGASRKTWRCAWATSTPSTATPSAAGTSRRCPWRTST
jgi:hypothetical protein